MRVIKPITKRRFIRGRGENAKFWEVEVSDSSYTTRFGRVGETGLQQTTECESPEAARKAADRLVYKKLGSGFHEELEHGAPPKAAEAAAPVLPNSVGQASGRIGETPAGEIALRSPESLHKRESVAQAWERLEAFVKQHFPHPHRTFRRPVPVEELANLEETLGFALPTSVLESYLHHNGQSPNSIGLIYGLSLLSLDEILETVDTWKKLPSDAVPEGGLHSFPVDTVQESSYDQKWLPLAKDFRGNYLAIDLNPASRGHQGQVIAFGVDDGFHPVVALDWAQFLTDVADELERGNYYFEANNTGELEFSMAWPQQNCSFFSSAIYWSRAKLSLVDLDEEDEVLWRRMIERSSS